ncbi:uncharacterized protein LOC135499971 [Lineus longissimus]|uniref:uncharacterized protein LOC135499971 n=1 Tax=Lineus longissimus TaxID=88925 RepID=UPI00315C8332
MATANPLDLLTRAAAQEMERLDREIADLTREITIRDVSPIAATPGRRRPVRLEEEGVVAEPPNSTRNDDAATGTAASPTHPAPANEAAAGSVPAAETELLVAVKELCTMLCQTQRTSGNVTTGANESMTSAIEQLALKSALPPLEVVKFTGDATEYFRFITRYETMVGSQNLTEAQKMARLLQFVDGRAKRSISGFDGVLGGLAQALETLKRRFGQPHVVAEACVEKLIGGPNLDTNDVQGLCDFADKSRTLFETLKGLKAVGEMNMSNMQKMSRKMPVRLQVKWRDEAQRVKRDTGKLPGVEVLVRFIERAAEAVSDPVFGKIADNRSNSGKPKTTQGKPTFGGKQDNARPVASTFATSTSTSSSHLKCYDCGDNHRLGDCEVFKAKDLKQRAAFVKTHNLCFNCLGRSHVSKDCNVKVQCQVCGKKHSTLLHRYQVSGNANSTRPQRVQQPVNANSTGVCTINSNVLQRNSGQVALQVVPIRIYGESGTSLTTLALLDSCCQDTFVKKSLADKLHLHVASYEPIEIQTMTGIGTVLSGHVDFSVEGASNPMRRVQIRGRAVEGLTVNSVHPGDLQRWDHLKDIKMVDVEIPEVNLILGANIPEVLVHIESRLGRSGEP